MELIKDTGITLQATAFREKDRILKVLTRQRGVVSLIIKRISPKRNILARLAAPFSFGEFVYKTGRGEIGLLLEGDLQQANLALRQKLIFLKTAQNMCQVILKTQMPHKPAPALFLLLKSYLAQIPIFTDLAVLLSSFKLKILLYEGLLSVEKEDPLLPLAVAKSFAELLANKISAAQEARVKNLILQHYY